MTVYATTETKYKKKEKLNRQTGVELYEHYYKMNQKNRTKFRNV